MKGFFWILFLFVLFKIILKAEEVEISFFQDFVSKHSSKQYDFIISIDVNQCISCCVNATKLLLQELPPKSHTALFLTGNSNKIDRFGFSTLFNIRVEDVFVDEGNNLYEKIKDKSKFPFFIIFKNNKFDTIFYNYRINYLKLERLLKIHKNVKFEIDTINENKFFLPFIKNFMFISKDSLLLFDGLMYKCFVYSMTKQKITDTINVSDYVRNYFLKDPEQIEEARETFKQGILPSYQNIIFNNEKKVLLSANLLSKIEKIEKEGKPVKRLYPQMCILELGSIETVKPYPRFSDFLLYPLFNFDSLYYFVPLDKYSPDTGNFSNRPWILKFEKDTVIPYLYLKDIGEFYDFFKNLNKKEYEDILYDTQIGLGLSGELAFLNPYKEFFFIFYGSKLKKYDFKQVKRIWFTDKKIVDISNIGQYWLVFLLSRNSKLEILYFNRSGILIEIDEIDIPVPKDDEIQNVIYGGYSDAKFYFLLKFKNQRYRLLSVLG